MITEEFKAFIKILYLIIRSGLQGVIGEFPGKGRKHLGWITLSQNRLKR